MSEWPKITADTPLEEIQEIHKKIWTHAIEFGSKYTDTPYLNNCVLCEYADLNCYEISPEYPQHTRCQLCPARWPVNKPSEFMHYCLESTYGQWIDAKVNQFTKAVRWALAIKVRDVEFKSPEEYADEIQKYKEELQNG